VLPRRNLHSFCLKKHGAIVRLVFDLHAGRPRFDLKNAKNKASRRACHRLSAVC